MASSINNVLASSGLFSLNNSNNQGSSGVDLSGLYSSLASGSSVNNNSTPIPKPKTFTTPTVAAPVADARSLATRITDVKNLSNFVNSDAVPVGAISANKDLKASFTLFKALDNLRTLAQYASEKGTSTSELASLDAQFKKGLAQVESYIGTADTTQLNYLFGGKPTHAPSQAITQARLGANYNGVGVATDRSAALTNISPTAKFTITLNKLTTISGVTTPSANPDTVTIDFSTISGNITLDKVIKTINDAIAAVPSTDNSGNVLTGADGKAVPKYLTKVGFVPDQNGKLGLQFIEQPNESVRLADAAPAPTAYLLNATTDSNSKSVGQLVRIDTLDATPTSTTINDKIAGVDSVRTKIDQAAFDADPPKPNALLGKLAPKIVRPGDVLNNSTVSATAVDSEGFVYVVGTSSGTLGSNKGLSSSDLLLTKYDSNGKALFSRVLGDGGISNGVALSIDANNNVIVAGNTDGHTSSTDLFSGTDSFVTKFSSDGKELFTTQLDSVATDGARALTTDASGNIYVTGTIKGAFSGQSGAGGQDGYLAKIDGKSGKTLALTQFGTAGTDTPSSIALAGDGSILVGGTEDGSAVIRKFDASDITSGSSTVTLGTATLNQLVVDATTGDVVVAGNSSTDLPGYPGSKGGKDGFVAKLDSSLAVQNIAYVGGEGTDSINGLAVSNGKIYVAGQTSDTLGDKKTGTSDAYLARLDLATLAQENVTQLGTKDVATSGNALAVTTNGPGVLASLGLRAGPLADTQAADLLSQTALRPGDSFGIRVNGGTLRTITIASGETFKSLAQKITNAAVGKVKATASQTTSSGSIDIRQQGDATITLEPGKSGQDVLAKLGIDPIKLLPSKILFNLSTSTDKSKQAEQRPGGTFALSLDTGLTIATKQDASYVKTQLDTAVATVQRAYRSLYFNETAARAALSKGTSSGTVPAYITAQNAGYAAALARLQSQSTDSNSGLLL